MISIYHIKTRFLLTFFFLIWITGQNLWAASPIVLEERNDGIPLGIHLDVFEDKEGRLTIAEVASEKIAEKFVVSQVNLPSFGYTHSVYWARFTVKNPSVDVINWFLEIEYPYIDYIDLYIPGTAGGFSVKKTGQFRPFSSRDVDYRNFVFALEEASKSKRTYYLRFQSEDAMIFIPTMWFEGGFHKKVSRDQMILGLFYGIALAMVIYNFFLFLSVREKAYLYYVLAVGSACFFLIPVLDGLAYQYYWPNWVGWANYSLPISVITFMLAATIFTRTFLNTPIVIPKWDRSLLVFIVAYLICFIPSILVSYYWGTLVMIVGVAFYIIFLGIIAILCMKRGSRPARYFLIAASFLVLGGFFYVLKTLGLIEDNIFINNAIKIGGVIQMLVFSLGLADRINTIKKEREDAQQKAIQNLKVAEKLKDEFLANTSHELRTPLNGIIGIAESLIDGAAGAASKQMKTNLSMIVSSGKRLSNLVNDILDFSKLKHREIQIQSKSVSIKILTDIVLSISRPLLAGKEIELINRISQAIPPVNGDENRLQQILINLVGNAVKFTEKGEIVVSAEVKGDKVEVAVVDTGIGIPQDKLTDIFRSFEQVDASIEREYAGTGLGLSITRQLVELHGGHLQVKSTVGKGSTFTFSIPLSSDPVTEISETAPVILRLEEDEQEIPSEVPVTGNHHVLVVDDDITNLQVLNNHLKLQGYSVTSALNGMEALIAVESVKPDIVLLDIMMPKMSGYEVCEKIRESHSPNQLPILMLTAKNQISDLLEGFSVGVSDYLPKPFSKKELLARVKTHLRLSQQHRELKQYSDKMDELVKLRTIKLEKQHRELKDTQAQLVQSEKMAGLGTLVAGIAHEINNPANFLKSGALNLKDRLENLEGFIYKLAGDDLAPSIRIELEERFNPLHINLEAIDDGVHRIREIVQNLRVFSRLEEAEQKTVSVVDGLKSTLTLVKVNFKDVVEFICNYEYDPMVKCWPSQLNQVFMNIMVNACQAIQTKIEQSGSTMQGRLEISTSVQDDQLKIRFHDNGCGMTEDVKQKIFEPFFTTKDVGLGTGLGMSIAFGIIEKHNSQILIDSTPGEGTIITITLPV